MALRLFCKPLWRCKSLHFFLLGPQHHIARNYCLVQVQRLVRTIVIAMVLQTDMKLHMSTITTFILRHKTLGGWALQIEDVLLALQLCLKVFLRDTSVQSGL